MSIGETQTSIPSNPKTRPNIYLKNRNQVNFLIAHIHVKPKPVLLSFNSKLQITTPPAALFTLVRFACQPCQCQSCLCQANRATVLVSLFFAAREYCFLLFFIQNILFFSVFLFKIFCFFLFFEEMMSVFCLFFVLPPLDSLNYRLISLLSIFDKIIEKIIHKRLYNFLGDNNIIFNNQFGFQKNILTSVALIQITEKIKESIDNRKFGCGLFIDLRKAFNTANHVN